MKRSKKEILMQKATLLYDEVYRFAFSRVKDRDAAQDIAQTVMETAMIKIDAIRDETALKQWIMTITFNKIQNHFRILKEEQGRSVRDFDDQAVIEQISDDEADILKNLTVQESRKNAITALLRIDKKYSDVIKQHIIYGDTFRVVAEKPGINYNTAKTRYLRGIPILREEFLKIEEGKMQDDK